MAITYKPLAEVDTATYDKTTDNVIIEKSGAIKRVAASTFATDSDLRTHTTWISSETEQRTAADETLQTNIDAEASARTAADTALQTSIDANTESIATLTETLGAAVYTGTLGGRSVTCYSGLHLVDLGSVATSSVAENWAARAEIAGSQAIRFITYTNATNGSTGFIIQQHDRPSNKTQQVLLLGVRMYIRTITGATGTEGDTTSAGSWATYGAAHLTYTASTRLLALLDYANNVLHSVALPEATTTAAGLLSASDKAKIADLETRVAALEAAAS